MSEPYSRPEIEALLRRDPNALPQRGQFCPRCEKYIPQFADITPDVEAELRRSSIEVVREKLPQLTGCSEVWTKLWMVHADGPHEADPPPKPCPYCGNMLKTGRAQQCLACGADWHNKTPNTA
jgi:hypothetical protein